MRGHFHPIIAEFILNLVLHRIKKTFDSTSHQKSLLHPTKNIVPKISSVYSVLHSLTFN